MTRNDLYKDILPKLVVYLRTAGIITEVERDNVIDEITLTHYQEAAAQLMAIPTTVQFIKIIKAIHDGIGDNTEILYVLPVRHKTAEQDDKERLVVFCYKTSTLAVMPVKTVIHEVNDSTSTDLESTCSKILDLIWLAYKDNNTELDYLWECCRGQHENDYFLLTGDPDTPERNWRLYSYAYFCFVNEYRFERPAILIFNKDEQFSPSIVFNPGNKYEQYFDAYNVMSESKYADDVLLRYLRMYQILEYFGYRRTLADLTKGNIRENGFVRNVINKASGRSANELTEIKNGVSDLLPPLASTTSVTGVFAATDITTPMENFIKDKLLLTRYSFCNEQLWNVIYKLRNCIVHNKESELHFTYSNTKVYEDGIRLMRLIIQKLEPEIVKIINDSTVDGLEFTEQRVQVY